MGTDLAILCCKSSTTCKRSSLRFRYDDWENHWQILCSLLFMKPVSNDVLLCDKVHAGIIMLEFIIRCVNYNQEGIERISNNTQSLCCIQVMLGISKPKVCQEYVLMVLVLMVLVPQQKLWFIRPGYAFQVFNPSVLVILCPLQPQLSFLGWQKWTWRWIYCCSSSTSRFNVFCILRCFPSQSICTDWISELL